MAQLVAGGYSIEYFIEGGRSRTGRLLPPKAGSLAMTVRALPAPAQPPGAVPAGVSATRADGRPQLPGRAVRQAEGKGIDLAAAAGHPQVLRSNFGQVVVNFGEPIRLDDVLPRMPAGTASPVPRTKAAWLSDTIDELAQAIQVNVNRAADVNPINLLALAMLSTPRHAMGEADLLAQIALAQTLLADVPYPSTSPSPPAADHRPRRGDRDLSRTPIRSATCCRWTARQRCCSAISATTCCTCSRLRRGSRSASSTTAAWAAPSCSAWGAPLSVPAGRTVPCPGTRTASPNASTAPSGLRARGPAATGRRRRRRHLPAQCRADRRSVPPARTACVAAGVRALLHRDLGAGEERPGKLRPANWKACASWRRSGCRCCTPTPRQILRQILFRGFIQKLRELKLVWADGNGKLAFRRTPERLGQDAKWCWGASCATPSRRSARTAPAPPANSRRCRRTAGRRGVRRRLNARRTAPAYAC